MKQRGVYFFHLFLILSLALAFSMTGKGQTYDLTGIWSDENGSKYKIRQVSNEIFWSVDASPRVINAFYGFISGSTIIGKWADLPEGSLRNSGTLQLRVESNDRMVKVSSSIPYGSSIWTRGAPAQPQGLPFLGTWQETDHVHDGCTNKQDFCIAYKRDVQFSQLSDGRIKAIMLNGSVELMGAYNAKNRTYSFNLVRNGQPYGDGKFIFSADYRSFSGNFSDNNGHRGYWNGQR